MSGVDGAETPIGIIIGILTETKRAKFGRPEWLRLPVKRVVGETEHRWHITELLLLLRFPAWSLHPTSIPFPSHSIHATIFRVAE